MIRRILSLAVLLVTGAAQAMATACPMGIAGGGHHPVVHHASAHGDPDAAASSHADRAGRGSSAEIGVPPESGPSSGSPIDTGAPCALTMSCAPLMPAPSEPLAVLGSAADVALPPVSRHLHSTDVRAATPPPRSLA